MDRLIRLRARASLVPQPSERSRRLLPPVAAIVAGVLLIAAGTVFPQFVGAVLIGFGLLLARGWVRIADAWWSDPLGQIAAAARNVRLHAPPWAWPAMVAALLLSAAAMLVRGVLRDGTFDGRTLGDLGKGVIALAMMATLGLWSVDRLPGRFGHWQERWSADIDGRRQDSAGESEARADT